MCRPPFRRAGVGTARPAPPATRRYARLKTKADATTLCQARGQCVLFSGIQVPVENLLARPVQHAVEFCKIFVDRFEILDARGLAAQVRMNRDGQNLWPARSFFVQTIEGV